MGKKRIYIEVEKRNNRKNVFESCSCFKSSFQGKFSFFSILSLNSNSQLIFFVLRLKIAVMKIVVVTVMIIIIIDLFIEGL